MVADQVIRLTRKKARREREKDKNMAYVLGMHSRRLAATCNAMEEAIDDELPSMRSECIMADPALYRRMATYYQARSAATAGELSDIYATVAMLYEQSADADSLDRAVVLNKIHELF